MAQHQDHAIDGDSAVPAFWPEALKIIKSAPIGLLATAQGRQPHVRPVTPAYVGLNAYVLTASGTPKLDQIRNNERVELLHWTVDFRHLNLAGVAFAQAGRLGIFSPMYFLLARKPE